MGKERKEPVITAIGAARLSGLSPHMLVYLARTDLLVPSGGRAPGRGRRRLYTFNDVVFLRVIADLLATGIEVKRLKSALKKAHTDTASWIDIRREPRSFLVTDGTEILVRRKGKLESKTVNGQFVFGFVLDLKQPHAAVAKEWESELARERARIGALKKNRKRKAT